MPETLKVLHLTRETGSDARYGIGKSLGPVLAALPSCGVEAVLLDQGVVQQAPPSLRLRLLLNMTLAIDRRINQGRNAPLWLMLYERLNVAHAAAWLLKHQPPLCNLAKVTHIHCHDPILVAALRYFLGRSHSFKIGFTAHAFGRFVQARPGLPLSGQLFRHLQKMEKREAERADFLLAPSRSGLQALTDELSLPGTLLPWRAIPHPRPQLTRPDPSTRSRIRTERGWTDEHFVIVAVGQLIVMKNFPLIIEACAQLRFQAPQKLRLLILGDGDTEPLRTCARAAGIDDALEFAVTDDIGNWLAGTDLYVSASATESFGMANFEALCAGLPAVCSQVGAVPEIMGDGALLIEPQVDALHSAMQSLIDDPAARQALADRGYRHAQNWPQADEIARRYAAMYTDIAKP